jgi:hypothetical protein
MSIACLLLDCWVVYGGDGGGSSIPRFLPRSACCRITTFVFFWWGFLSPGTFLPSARTTTVPACWHAGMLLLVSPVQHSATATRSARCAHHTHFTKFALLQFYSAPPPRDHCAMRTLRWPQTDRMCQSCPIALCVRLSESLTRRLRVPSFLHGCSRSCRRHVQTSFQEEAHKGSVVCGATSTDGARSLEGGGRGGRGDTSAWEKYFQRV